MSQSFRKKVPETCRYWKEGKCIKGEYQCSFVHGFVCPDDKRCRRDNCGRFHLSQKNRPQQRDNRGKPYQSQRQGHHGRSRRSHSQSTSPVRHQKISHNRRTPTRRRSRSRSPPYHQTKSYSSPRRRSRSISPSQYHKSSSWRRSRSRSPAKLRSRSSSPTKAKYRSHSQERSRSRSRNSGRRRSRSCSPIKPKYRSHSHDRSPSSSRSLGRPRSRSRSTGRHRSRSRRIDKRRSRSYSSGRRQSRSRSPARYRSNSRSPDRHQRSCSLTRLRSRSPTKPQAGCSQNQLRSRSRSLTKHNRSHSIARPYQRSRSSSKHSSTSTSSSSRSRSKSCSPSRPQNKSKSPDHHQSKSYSPAQERSSHSIPHENQLDLEDMYADLDEKMDEFPSSTKQQNQSAAEKLAFSQLEARITKTMKEMYKTATEKSSNGTPKQKISEEPYLSDENIDDDKGGLGLEEVGEEVGDIFAKSIIWSVNDSIENAFKEGLQSGKRQREFQAGSNPSPPKPKPLPKPTQEPVKTDIGYRSDWELKTALENPSKPMPKQFQVPMGPPKLACSGGKSTSTSLWTPALDRRQVQESKLKMTYQNRSSDWEVETPYVGRKDKIEVQQDDAISGREGKTGSRPVTVATLPQPEPVVSYEKAQLKERNQDQNVEQISQPNTMLFPSGKSMSVGASSAVPQTRSHVIMPAISSSSASANAFEAATFSTPLTQPVDHKEEFTKAVPPEGGGTSSKRASVEHKSRKPSESPKRPKHRRHKERKSKRKRSSDSESHSDKSDHEKRKAEKNAPQIMKVKNDVEMLFSKKDSLVKRVKMLVEQKNMMNEKRDDIIKNHKGSREGLASLLEENSFLMNEIGKQINKINSMVHTVNQEIEAEKGIKQKHKSTSKERSESPCHSQDRKRKLGHSPEREKHNSTYHSPERSEFSTSSFLKDKKTRTPQRKENWSPVPVKQIAQNKSDEPSKTIEQGHKYSKSPQWAEQKRSRSPQWAEQKRSSSPQWAEQKQSRSPQWAQQNRSRSPQWAEQKRSRSPQWAEQKRSNSPRWNEQTQSRSPAPKLLKRYKSRSPNPTLSRENKRHLTPPELERVQSQTKKYQVNTETGQKMASYKGKDRHESAKEEFVEAMQYAPLGSQRSYIRYMDQGMHWCKLCSLFCETVPEFVSHLMTPSHLARVKNDRKTWLAKAPREEKEPKPPNAQILTVPLQGMEFLHSLPAYYCSLCDVFMRNKGEAVNHPESKIHVSKYKVHRAKNPMYESTFMKAKTAAYAKYSIDEERKLLEGQLNLREKNAAFELEEKLLRQIKEKRDKEKFEKENRDDKTATEAREDKNKDCGSIRVASRGSGRSADTKYDDRHRHSDSSKRQSDEHQVHHQDDVKSKPKLKDDSSRRGESHKNEKSHSNREKEIKGNDVQQELCTDAGDTSKNKEEEKKTAAPKLPLIGKMPFLKKKPSVSKTKEQQKVACIKQEMSVQPDLLVEEAKAIVHLESNLSTVEAKAEFEAEKLGDLAALLVCQNKEIVTQETESKIHETQELPLVGNGEDASDNVSMPVLNEVKDISSTESVNSLQEHVSELYNIEDEESSDSDDFKMYDSLEMGNDESSECAAAATLHALDLLSIPLPGLKTVVETASSSDILLPPGTEHEPQSQQNLILSLPPGAEDDPSDTYESENKSYVSVIENSQSLMPSSEQGVLDHSSGVWSIIGNSNESLKNSCSGNKDKLELPFSSEAETLPHGQSDPNIPPPPGTEDEGPDYHLACENDPVSSVMIVPVFEPGFQEHSLGACSVGSNSQDDFRVSFPVRTEVTPEIPPPPGTEDELCLQNISCLPPPLEVAENIALQCDLDNQGVTSQTYIPKHSSGTCSSCSNSLDEFPISLSSTDVPSAALALGMGHPQWPALQTATPMAVELATDFTDWSSLHQREREKTPPPPGTENLIINELDDVPVELGEASMELSEDSESESLDEKREITPPPPGTESSSESVTANNTSCQNVSSKSSPLPSSLENTENVHNMQDGAKLFPPSDVSSKDNMYFVEGEKYAELPSQVHQENYETFVPPEKIVVKMTCSNSSSSVDIVSHLPVGEHSSLLHDQNVRPDLKVQISSDVKIPACKPDLNNLPVTDGVSSSVQHINTTEVCALEVIDKDKNLKAPEFPTQNLSLSCGNSDSAKFDSESLKDNTASMNYEAKNSTNESVKHGSTDTAGEIHGKKTEIKSLVHIKIPKNLNENIGVYADAILSPSTAEKIEETLYDKFESCNKLEFEKGFQSLFPSGQYIDKSCSQRSKSSQITEGDITPVGMLKSSLEVAEPDKLTCKEDCEIELDKVGSKNNSKSAKTEKDVHAEEEVRQYQCTHEITSIMGTTVGDQEESKMEELEQHEHELNPSKISAVSGMGQENKMKHNLEPLSRGSKMAVAESIEETRIKLTVPAILTVSTQVTLEEVPRLQQPLSTVSTTSALVEEARIERPSLSTETTTLTFVQEARTEPPSLSTETTTLALVEEARIERPSLSTETTTLAFVQEARIEPPSLSTETTTLAFVQEARIEPPSLSTETTSALGEESRIEQPSLSIESTTSALEMESRIELPSLSIESTTSAVEEESRIEQPSLSIESTTSALEEESRIKQPSLSTETTTSAVEEESRIERPSLSIESTEESRIERPSLSIESTEESRIERPSLSIESTEESRIERPSLSIESTEESRIERPSLSIEPSALEEESRIELPSLSVESSVLEEESIIELPSLLIESTSTVLEEESRVERPSLSIESTTSALEKESKIDQPSLSIESTTSALEEESRKELPSVLIASTSTVLEEDSKIELPSLLMASTSIAFEEESRVERLSLSIESTTSAFEEEPRIEISSPSRITKTVALDEQESELKELVEKLEIYPKGGGLNSELENQEIKVEFFGMRESSRSPKTTFNKEKGVKRAVDQEDKLQVVKILPQRTTRAATRSAVLEREQGKHCSEMASEESEKVTCGESLRQNDCNGPQSSEITEPQKVVQLMDKAEVKQIASKKVIRSKQGKGNKELEEIYKAEVPTKNIKPSCSMNRTSCKETTEINAFRSTRSNRRAAVAASAAMTAQAQVSSPVTSSSEASSGDESE
ncbi:uncharacterized protein [Procambarus clarkii]|uniref:uncharacterized protein isoform X2 n=1 Tax=Procambarus clarkii TaxID=6728 RepID=UPI0037441674